MPALYPLLIKNLFTLRDDHLMTIGILQRYYLMKGDKCESFLHFLFYTREVKIAQEMLTSDYIDYI